MGDFWFVVVLGEDGEEPSVCVMEPKDIRKIIERRSADLSEEGQLWLERKEYERFEENNLQRIGAKLLEWYLSKRQDGNKTKR